MALSRGAEVRRFPLHREQGWNGTAYERFVRIGFGCSTELFEEGLTTLMQELQNWQGDELHTEG